MRKPHNLNESDTKKWSESGVAYLHDCRRNSLLGSVGEPFFVVKRFWYEGFWYDNTFV